MNTTTHDHEIVDRNGRRVSRSGIVQDGDTVRVAIRLMDSANPDLQTAIVAAQSAKRIEQFDASHAGHQPGFRLMDAAAATASERRRMERDAKLADAWKRPPAVVDQVTTHHVPPAKTTLTRHELIAKRDARLEAAWKR